jgi:EipB-like
LNKRYLFQALGLLTTACAALLGPPHLANSDSFRAAEASEAVQEKPYLVPHRAVYELTLADNTAASNLSAIRGQLLYDFDRKVCEGFALSTRLTTETTQLDGKMRTAEVRSESWEEEQGKQFVFSTTQYSNGKLSTRTQGAANRTGESITVKIEQPSRSKATLSGTVLFPTQHSARVLNAATLGQTLLEAPIYDGSEGAKTVYETRSTIGPRLAEKPNIQLQKVKNAEVLDSLMAWPVTVSYYSKGPDGLNLTYEVSFWMFANGVSRKLKLDYLTFSLNGELSSIDFFERKLCP